MTIPSSVIERQASMGTKIDVGSTVTSRLRLFFRDMELGVGTGFFYKSGSQLYLITNWHVVSGRNFQTLKHLSKNLALPDRLKYTVGCRGHVGEWMDIDCMLYEDSESSEQPERPVWIEHASHGHKVYIVAIPIDIPEIAEAYTIDRVNAAPQMRQYLEMCLFSVTRRELVEVGDFRFGRGPA